MLDEMAIKDGKIEMLREVDGFSKVFKRFSEKGLEDIEKEIVKMIKIVQ